MVMVPLEAPEELCQSRLALWFKNMHAWLTYRETFVRAEMGGYVQFNKHAHARWDGGSAGEMAQ